MSVARCGVPARTRFRLPTYLSLACLVSCEFAAGASAWLKTIFGWPSTRTRVTILYALTALLSSVVTALVTAGAGLFDRAPMASATGTFSARQEGSAGSLAGAPDPQPAAAAPVTATTAATAVARPILIMELLLIFFATKTPRYCRYEPYVRKASVTAGSLSR